jgi:simple sugar transport system substrate-binding protein
VPDSSTEAAPDKAQANAKKPVFHLVTHGMANDPFWAMAVKGWQDACEQHGIDGRYIGTKSDGNTTEMLRNLQTVLATGSDGIACVITNSSMLDQPLRQAINMGIPVLAVNTADFRAPDKRIPYLMYIGESSFNTGRANAEAVVKKFTELAGRPPKHSMFLLHAPGIQCLEQRGSGMMSVLERVGTKFSKVGCRFDATVTKTSIRSFLQANSDVETVHTAASQIAVWAVQTLRDLGRLGNVNKPFEEGKVYVGGIDIDHDLLSEIQNGNAIATIDQQPYLQGYYSAQTLFFYRNFGMLPSSDILTGPYVVDQDGAQKRIDQLNAIRGS